MDLEEQIRKYEEEAAQREANPAIIPKALGNSAPDGDEKKKETDTDLSKEI